MTTSSPAQDFLARGRALSNERRYVDAIEMFLSSISAEPDLLEAHQALWETGLLRKAEGGPSLGFFATMKLRRASGSDKQHLLNYSKLLAYDPSNAEYLVEATRMSGRLNLVQTNHWFADILRKSVGDKYPRLRL
jgi:hypothetical protein